ncbi:MAG: hypothetical protein HYV07_28820 [Deltaproteobacteria bacterium]|nr:hypothetical protein [Deltaproteobacteria bacterium]
MLEFFQAGGAPMFVLLALGVVALVAAGRFAHRPSREALGPIDALRRALIYASIAGLASDLMAVFTQVPAHPEWSKSPELHLIVMQGLGESMSPVVFGFTILNVMYVLVAVGERRLRAGA